MDAEAVELIVNKRKSGRQASKIKAIQTSFEDRDAWLKSRTAPEITAI